MNMKTKLMLFLLGVFLPALALADTGFYQPPTPVVKVDKTPGANNELPNKYPIDEYGNPYIRMYGSVPIVPLGGTPGATPAPVEVTPVARVIMLPTSLPTLFPVTPNVLINTDPLKSSTIQNTFNIDVECTYGAAGATPIPFPVPAGIQHYKNWAESNLKMSGGISCIHPANTTPAAGSIQAWGEK